jgi:hypothetical protein
LEKYTEQVEEYHKGFYILYVKEHIVQEQIVVYAFVDQVLTWIFDFDALYYYLNSQYKPIS